MFRSLRTAFITGIIVILPLGVTLIVINFLLQKLGTPSIGLFFWFVDSEVRDIPAVKFILGSTSVIIVCALITLLGYGSRFFVGRFILSGFERLLDRVPFINTVYRTVKQIVDTFGKENRAVFQEVVLIEYPRKRCYVLGFLTSEAKGEPQNMTGEKIVNIFVPTTPNPTSGFLLMVPDEDITRLTMSVAEGMKVIISGGAVVPPGNDEAVAIENPAEVSGTIEA